MIHLPNGFEFTFAAASGALGFDGDDADHGVVKLWKAPYRWLGLLDPRQFVVITKTVTFRPRQGNLRWYAPWRAARLLRPWSRRATVNAVGLTNPGLEWWLRKCYPRVQQKGYSVILSIHPENVDEAYTMASMAETRARGLVGLELNAGCPNVAHAEDTVAHTLATFGAVKAATRLPILVKFGYYQPWPEICDRLDGQAAAFDLINAMPWDGTGGESPLGKYGYAGAVSGGPIANYALDALRRAKEMTFTTPILSGGGVVTGAGGMTLREVVKERLTLGADAVAFGTEFLWSPAGPGRVVWELSKGEGHV